jgi:hypothetical protein
VLEEYNSKEHPSVVHFLCKKGLSVNDIHKDIFPVYGVECFSPKVFHNWVAKVSLVYN